MNIVLNILNKKQNLSYPLVFRKIANYYWNIHTIQKGYSLKSTFEIFIFCISNTYIKLFKFFRPVDIASYSALHGNETSLKYMLTKNPEIINEQELFSLPCLNGQVEIIRFLIENGADLNIVGKEGLHMSTIYSYYNVIDYLLSQKIDIKYIENAIFWSRRNERFEVANYLEKHIKN